MQKHNRLIFLILITLAIGLVAIVLATDRRTEKHFVLSPQTTAADGPNAKSKYIRRATLRPQLGWALTQLGDRLERPGKERTAAAGAVHFGTDPTPHSLVLLNEFPDRLRASISQGSNARTLIFDGISARSASRLSQADEALLETLVYDSAEHFFWSQAQQQATRFIGSRIRTDDGSTPNYTGPYYDVYQLTDAVKIGATQQVRSKFYYFNSETLLLERVLYQQTNQEKTIKVEVRLSDWRSVNDQRLPHRIERIEDGVSSFVFALGSINIVPRQDDGVFNQTPAN